MKPILTFCAHTVNHLKKISTTTNKMVLIGVKGGGCNGLRYYIDTIDPKKVGKDDERVRLDDTSEVVLCGKSVFHLIGSHLHWKQDGMGARIEFDNPNANATCGCGDTFNTE